MKKIKTANLPASWEKYGVEAIRADLQEGGHRLVGGPPANRQAAWDWVNAQERHVKFKEIFIFHPNLWGLGLNLPKLFAWIRTLLAGTGNTKCDEKRSSM